MPGCEGGGGVQLLLLLAGGVGPAGSSTIELVQKADVKRGGGAADEIGHGEVFRSVNNTTVCKCTPNYILVKLKQKTIKKPKYYKFLIAFFPGNQNKQKAILVLQYFLCTGKDFLLLDSGFNFPAAFHLS